MNLISSTTFISNFRMKLHAESKLKSKTKKLTRNNLKIKFNNWK